MMDQLAISFAEPSSERDMICEVVACKPDLFRAEFYLWLQDNGRNEAPAAPLAAGRLD